MTELERAIKILKKHLNKDKKEGSYYYSWQSNIAMYIHDNSNIGADKCNEIAKKFLDNFIGIN